MADGVDARGARRGRARRRPARARPGDLARRGRRPARVPARPRALSETRAGGRRSASPGRRASASRASSARSSRTCASASGRSASSRSTRRARSPAARCSAIASGSSDHFLDPGVYIRSMGTRGHLGGLAEATLQAVLLLDASGKDVVFVETVGAGQSEVEVTGIADTVLLVLMPGSGDSVQALKAGIMEIPDVIAINKMDHPAAKTMLNEVRSIVGLAEPRPAARRSSSPRRCAARTSPSCGRSSRSTAPRSSSDGRLEERRRRESRRRGVRGRVEPREDASPGGRRGATPSSSACSSRSRRRRELDPLTRRPRRSWRRCSASCRLASMATRRRR